MSGSGAFVEYMVIGFGVGIPLSVIVAVLEAKYDERSGKQGRGRSD